MAALFLLFLLLAAALAYSPLARTPGELVLHEFQNSGTLAVDARGNNSLILSTGMTWNTNRTGLNFGLSHSGTVSQNSWGPLYSAINQSRAWTFEFWIKSERTTLGQLEITLGGFHSLDASIIPTANPIDPGFPVPGDTTWAAFGVFNRAPNDSMFLSYAVHTDSCQQSANTVRGRINNTIYHLVYAVEEIPNQRVRMYQNGINVRTLTRNQDFIWDASDSYYLKVAPHLVDPVGNASSDFIGDMYLFALYDRALNTSEIMSNYLARIPNSVPLVYNQTVYGFEDSTNNFSVGVYDYDLVSFDHEIITCSILALPLQGTIIKPDGSAAMAPFSFSQNDTLGFVNQQDPESKANVTFGLPYANLTFHCVDLAGATSNTGTITFYINHVNHAPVATNFTVSINRTSTMISLQSHLSDKDYHDRLPRGTIAGFPMYGSVSNFNTGNNITVTPWNLTFTTSVDALKFYYLPNAGIGVPGEAIVFTDFVPYYVIDFPDPEYGNVPALASNTAYVQINVLNNLLINQNGDTTSYASGKQDNITLFTLPGTDINGQPIDGYVLSLPAVGKLYLPDGTEITAAGPFPYLAGRDPNNANSNGVYLRYEPPPLFYGNVSFGYVLQSRADGWTSANATLVFQVQYVNQPPTLTCNVTQLNISRLESVHVNFTMSDVDYQASPMYSYRFRNSIIVGVPDNGTVNAASDCNCTNITGSPTSPVVSATANGTYDAIRQAISSMTIFGQSEGEGILTLWVFDYNLNQQSQGIKANASVQIRYKVSAPTVKPPTKLGDLEQILVYVGIAVGGSLCIFCPCYYCYWSNKRLKKKYLEQGYAAEASAMSMDRL